MLDNPPAMTDKGRTVEVRVPGHDVVAWVEEIRRWLNAKRIQPLRVISTGNSSETIVLCEFSSSDDALSSTNAKPPSFMMR